MKRRLTGTIVILAAVFYAFLVLNASAAEKLAKKQVLTIAFDMGDGKTFDPHSAATTVDRATVDMIFNGLVRYTPGNQVEVEPDLAETWSASPDGKVWTFNLRKGSFFILFPVTRRAMN